jgi:hypothetical protein
MHQAGYWPPVLNRRSAREPDQLPRNGRARSDDNLRALTQFPSECVDLIYLDPPFFSNRNYEVIWGDEAEVRSFEDRWEGGIEVYTAWMRERMQQLHRILKPTGTLYLHCDWHAGHYLKVMCDGPLRSEELSQRGRVVLRGWGRSEKGFPP